MADTFLPRGPTTPNSIPNTALQTSGATAGSYTNADITVNSKGIITAVASGSGGGANGSVIRFSQGDTNGLDPADATTYLFGDNLGFDANPVNAFPVIMPKAGTCKTIYGFIFIAGTLASAGNSTFTLKNRTAVTSEVISSAVALTANPVRFNNTALTLTFNAGEELEISWLTPTWATNPTLVYIVMYMYIEFA